MLLQRVHPIFQFGIFLATALTAPVGIIALVTNRKKK